MKAPHGLNEIIETFGDVSEYVADDGIISAKEEAEFLTLIELPYPMVYAYNTGTVIKRMRCHKKMSEIFLAVFNDILASELSDKCMDFGGCYNFRSKRLNSRLSTHSWGIAVDINPSTNRMGTKGDMYKKVIAVFANHGFTWGGHWKISDPMHFQYASGY